MIFVVAVISNPQIMCLKAWFWFGFLAKKTRSGARYLERILKKYVDNFKGLLFYFHTSGVRPSVDVLHPENQPWIRIQ